MPESPFCLLSTAKQTEIPRSARNDKLEVTERS
jgi:hypothetical protein